MDVARVEINQVHVFSLENIFFVFLLKIFFYFSAGIGLEKFLFLFSLGIRVQY